MPAATLVGSAFGKMIRHLRGLGHRRKAALGFASLALVAGGLALHSWLMAWTPRLALGSPAGNFPLAFSADGSTLATGSPSGLVCLWDPKDGRRKAEWSSPDARRWVSGCFSPDGRIFAAFWYPTSSPGMPAVDLIDATNGHVRASIPFPLPNGLGYALRDEGRTLRVVAADRDLRVFTDVDVATGQAGPTRPLSTPGLPWSRATLSEHGGTLAIVDARPNPSSSSGLDRVVVWDLDLDRQVSVIPSRGRDEYIRSLALSADGKSLAIGRDGGSIEIWDVARARLDARWPIHGAEYRPFQLWFSPDGSKLASSARLNGPGLTFDTLAYLMKRSAGDRNPFMLELVVVDLLDGRRLGRSASDGGSAAFSRDGRSLATSDEGRGTDLHDIPDRR